MANKMLTIRSALGFIFLPMTTLAYARMLNTAEPLTGSHGHFRSYLTGHGGKCTGTRQWRIRFS
jgi:hypothetical protein